MKTANSYLDSLNKRLFSSTYQVQRIVILLGIVLVLAIISFGGYYWYDRYYSNQPPASPGGPFHVSGPTLASGRPRC